MYLLTRFFFIILLAIPTASFAHGYWIETEGSGQPGTAVTIKLFFGEYGAGEREAGKALDKMKEIRVYVIAPDGNKTEMAMSQTADYWEGTYTPTAEGNYIIIGVNDTRDVQDWTKHNLGIVRPIQYLKAYYTVGEKTHKQTPVLYLDATVSPVKAGYEIKVTENGKPAKEQKVHISAFGGQELDVITDKKGHANFTLKSPGLHIISIDYIDNTPGSFKNKQYATVRHRLDASLYHKVN